jgi:hypothetical protein
MEDISFLRITTYYLPTGQKAQAELHNLFVLLRIKCRATRHEHHQLTSLPEKSFTGTNKNSITWTQLVYFIVNSYRAGPAHHIGHLFADFIY